ncbi:MAG: hypothetical protein AB9888_03535 [Bacteroidales bacterium]
MKIYSDAVAPAGEQEICVTCGLCCDATLYMHANLQPGERGNLPLKIEAVSVTEGGKDFFRLPCGYFSGSCTIYDCQRAEVCSTYRCKLLKMYDGGVISREDAFRTVREAVAMRDSILDEYRRLTGRDAGAGFRRIPVELGLMLKEGLADEALAGAYEMLLVRCNILEALLIRFFMSDEEFEKFIMR